jgi:hypothetical protein
VTFRVVGEVADVLKGLRLGFVKVFAEGFMFDQQDAGPEKVDTAVVTGDSFYGLFKAGHDAALDAEYLEKLIPECLLLRALARGAFPLA